MELKFMKFPWSDKQPAKKRYAGLSQRPQIVAETKTVEKAPEEPKVAKAGERISPLQPYLDVIKDDIKTLLHIDEKRKRDKETHDDFMEQHFGRK
jgi:hypothetical protein